MINYTASILNGFKHFCCNFVHSYYSIEGLHQFGQKSWKVVTYALKLIVLPFGMFLIFALLNTWKSQYYTWPLFASSFCGKHGVAQGGFVCFSFVSSSFFLWKFSLPSFMNKEDINERKCGFGGGRQTETRGLEGSTFTPHTQVRWQTHLQTR